MEFVGGLAMGGNSKCIKMLLAFKELISDFPVSTQKVLRNELVGAIRKHEDFLYVQNAIYEIGANVANSMRV